jgi:hypothetical protein
VFCSALESPYILLSNPVVALASHSHNTNIIDPLTPFLPLWPRFVIGVDPNFSAWLEFQTIRHFAPKGALDRVRLEVMRGENIHLFEKTFDVMFCLGVLYVNIW